MSPLEKEQLDQIHLHAVEEYPYECCGIVVGNPDDNRDNVVYRCENIQNKLHEKDPENFTRDARTAYNISALELQKLLSEAGSKGRVFKVLYHSHPEHDAYFSEEDTRMALFDGETPIYPGTQCLVVSVYGEKVRDQALFGWNPGTKTFERNPL